ncbi:MAG: hypothetical protein ACK6EB_00410, partial [Planctomyces sp.]
QQEIDNAIIRRLPQLVPQPDSISWREVMATDRAVGEWEMLQIEQGNKLDWRVCLYLRSTYAAKLVAFLERM